MAALQSRARTQHQHQHQQAEQDGEARESRLSPHRGSERAAELAQDSDAWVLFSPEPSTSRTRSALSGDCAIADSDDLDSEQQQQVLPTTDSSEDPFQQPGHTSHSLSSSAWHLVSSSSSSAALEDGATRSPLEGARDNEEEEAEAGDEDGEDQENTLNNRSRWSAVPVPRRDGSSFFDDEDEEEALFSDKVHRQQTDGLFDDSDNSASIYPDVPALRMTKNSQNEGEDIDMLSLPSSLSVSDRSSSRDLPSPEFDYPGTSFEPSPRHDEDIGSSNITLTEAALSRISTANAFATGEAETALTSGSEDEADDHDETLLSRAPDAISAGIRPSRRRTLQSIRAPSQLSSALSGGKISSSQRSATKRRHRQSGISDKGSKRSNNSANLLNLQHLRTSNAAYRRKEDLDDLQPVQADTLPPPKGRAARFSRAARQAARDIFSVDEEVMKMMAQPGSVFSQARPLAPHQQRGLSERSIHGLSAFSAHMANELGDAPGIHGLFTSLYSEEESVNSGDETETERDIRHDHARRSRRRSSLFADGLHFQQRYTQESRTSGHENSLSASLTAEQLHTASLGLHRSFSLAGLQHFLIDSVYNSLSSSMLGTPRSPSSNLSASLNQSSSFMSARKRTHSAPSVERSHSSSDIYSQANSVDEEQPETLEYKEAVSYWRRVLRSFAF